MVNQASANITTAVDSLVKLVNKKKKISMEEAAQELGLPESIINEWASFLEEEKIISIEYQLTTPYLAAVTETEEEKEERTDSDDIEKDLLLRKIQFMKSSLDKYKTKPTIKIKNVDDLKKAIKSNLSRNNKLYAQKVYLQMSLDRLLNKLKNKKEDVYKINQDVMVLEKRKRAFEKNF